MLINISLDSFLQPRQIAQTGLPDLAEPEYLSQIASQLPLSIAIFVMLAIGLTAAMALFNFSLRNSTSEHVAIGDWTIRSTQLMRGLQQVLVIAMLLLAGFGLCSTLATSQHNWEQARLVKTTPPTAAEFVQQASPQVSYTSQEPYIYTTQLDGKLVKVEDKKEVTHQSAVSSSNILVSIAPALTKTGDGNNYPIDFTGDYQVTNSIETTDKFVFQITPPKGYSLLQNFGVEQDGKKLKTTSPGEYRFPIQIAPGNVSKLHVTYRAQGSPQWVYSAKDGSLANFKMAVSTKVPGLNFVNGIVPTKVSSTGDRQVFSWAFVGGASPLEHKNASVQKPFGVAVAPPVATQSGQLPLLLLLAPGILLWWLLLLCFSIPMRLQQIAIAGLVFFAGIFALTYFGRLTDPLYVWSGISVGLLILVWGLGRKNWRVSLAAVICTILGAIFPVYGFLIGARGVMLSIAALLSVIWLTARNWYGWYQLEPSANSMNNSTTAHPLSVLPHQNLLEESVAQERLNPALTAEEIAQRLREEGARDDL
jgi:hypothetical protein